uniref:Small ribosomal subunit protein uS3c n=1 Tax=Nephroselmis astigmatica TaxID=259378 RepID=A0A088CKA3_9CHLO|nr:ribosomal protein S3 [Nephroselmis astigmatica]AID67732.1 ribosomal protein S3 [Nephroselmis astigmatica]
MGQKIHPLGLRIGITQKHRATWFAKPAHYASLVQEDHLLRSYLESSLANAGVARIDIHRKADCIEIHIHTVRAGIILGSNGKGLQEIRQQIDHLLGGARPISLRVIEVEKPDTSAKLIGDFVAEQLEKRIPYRRAVRQAVQRAKSNQVGGIKIQVAGRLNGAEIARIDWQRAGRVPLQTLRADIDYCSRTAKTIYGVLGIKVWIFNQEILPTSSNVQN